MELFLLKHLNYLLLHAILLLSAFGYSQGVTSSRATYYGSPEWEGNPTGACGYGEYGRRVNDANVAGVSWLWYGGTGCGACYQVRCKIPQHCNDEGVSVVVTDYGEGHGTDFILSTSAYARLARPGTEEQLFSFGVVEIEYRRIPCQYTGYNLVFKVNEHSKNPHYLAIVILHVAGINDILAVEIWQEDCKEWRKMRRVYGAVHDMENPPRGDITLRLSIHGSTGIKWVQFNNVIPGDWSPGAAYESTTQLT